jgi:26S proteasome regulatory subunit N10
LRSQLALKHRQNRSQRQRIIAFVCSPVEESEKELVQLAKKMKKGNISIDFVLFGELDDDTTQKKLQAFNDAVKGNEGSHLVVIPPSSKLLSDQLISTPIMLGEGAGAGGGGSGANDEFEFGFDPAIEPELALALRMSMEEEKARQERVAKEQEEEAKKASLESVKEENEASGSGSGSGGSADKDKDKDSGDKMDTS